ncbi:GNAT family N-acetyltransferase [Streptomyces mirabilis]|uniref:GNAT family N-acetyltransferase n=1 Tax=Streptomyces mirabilis TaxID=68239 RepID=UPI00201E38B3|nr:GNAT family N-acetyltransferase [Streptomyces mirabilis]
MSGTGRGCTCTAATCCPSTAASQGTGSAMLNWAESRIRQLVQQHGTAQTAVIGANAMASEQEATALLLETGYRRVFSLVELELADLRQLPDEEQWTFESFLATADPTCWRAAWEGESKAGGRPVLHPSARPNCGRSRELSVRAESRRLGLGRALLLGGVRCLREHGAKTARLYTGTANPHRSYDLYESVGFRRQNEYVRYRKPIAV